MPVLYNRLGELLIDKMSQSELRKKAGIDPDTKVKMYRGEVLYLASLSKICRVLDFDSEDITEHKCPK